MKRNKQAAGTALATVMMLMPVCAYAQTAPVAAPAAPPATAAASDSSNFDIVVTAQRRAERVQDVPISMTVQSGAQLQSAGITNIRDLALVTPGLTILAQGNNVQPALRGITTFVSGPGADNPIAIYIDGIYEGSQASSTIDLPDVDRVEVLKGPQGTLFGRNATGGAIQIFTRKPSFTWTGKFTATAGLFDGAGSSRSAHDLMGSGFISGPIIPDILAASLSFSRQDINGYSRNIAVRALPQNIADRFGSDRMDFVKSTYVRGKLLFQPTDNFSVEASAYYSRYKTDRGSVGLPLNGITSASIYPDAIFGTRPWESAYDSPNPFSLNRRWGFSVQGQWKLDAGTITSTTALTRSRFIEQNDVDAAYSPLCQIARACSSFIDSQPNNNFSQELLFSSRKLGHIQFTVGANLWTSTGGAPAVVNDFRQGVQPAAPEIILNPTFVADMQVKTRALGAFVDATYDVTDHLALIVGARYSHEEKSAQLSLFGVPAILPDPNKSWNSFTPRVVLRYALDNNSNIYASFSKGFKSGVFPLWSNAAPPVNPEKITAYEMGFKTASRTLSFNAAAFYYDYKDLQVQAFTGTTTITTNAASARIFGIELSGSANLGSGFSLSAGGSWLPTAEYRKFTTATAFGFPRRVNGTLTSLFPLDLSGSDLLRTPKLTANASASYESRLGSGKINLSANAQYSSSYAADPLAIVVQHDFVRLGTNFSYKPDQGGWELSFWTKNLTNTASLAGAGVNANAARVTYQPPRELGITAQYSF